MYCVCVCMCLRGCVYIVTEGIRKSIDQSSFTFMRVLHMCVHMHARVYIRVYCHIVLFLHGTARELQLTSGSDPRPIESRVSRDDAMHPRFFHTPLSLSLSFSLHARSQ